MRDAAPEEFSNFAEVVRDYQSGLIDASAARARAAAVNPAFSKPFDWAVAFSALGVLIAFITLMHDIYSQNAPDEIGSAVLEALHNAQATNEQILEAVRDKAGSDVATQLEITKLRAEMARLEQQVDGLQPSANRVESRPVRRRRERDAAKKAKD
jgi:hypothetical protein